MPALHRPTRLASAAAVVVLAAATSGCNDPYQKLGPPPKAKPTAAQQRLAIAQRTGELPPEHTPKTAPPAERRALSPTPTAAIRAFAMAFTNWTWRTVHADQVALARASVGQARASMILAAQSSTDPGQLAAGEITNRGTVAAIAPLTGHPGRYVVVTKESSSSHSRELVGAGGAYHLTLASAQHYQGGWAVSTWDPQN